MWQMGGLGPMQGQANHFTRKFEPLNIPRGGYDLFTDVQHQVMLPENSNTLSIATSMRPIVFIERSIDIWPRTEPDTSSGIALPLRISRSGHGLPHTVSHVVSRKAQS